jgi:hypothetical protein
MSIVGQRTANDNTPSSFERLVARLATAMRVEVDEDLPFGDMEALLLDATNEAVRRSLERRLQRISNRLGDAVIVGSHTYRRHHPGRVKYFSLCGSMEVERWTYRRIDERNGRTIVALDKAAGLAEGATPALAFAVAQGVAKAPIRSVEQDLRAAHRSPPSRAKMDRIGRHLGDQVNQAVEEIEPELRAAEELPVGAKAINLGLDRTTIPMEESAEPDGSGNDAKVAVRYRMGYVGTFCITDRNCEPLITRRYAAPAHEGPDRLLARMKADLERALQQNRDLTIGVVQDGAPEMWNLMRGMLDSIPQLARPRQMGKPRHWRETIDRYHLMERLSRVLELLLPKSAKRRAEIYAEWSADLDCRAGAIHSIEEWIEDKRRKVSRRTAREVDRTVGCYLVCRDHFRYATLRRLGLQQGSGVTEGACKSLITARAKRSGQRWREVGISAILALRSLLDSDRLPAFWSRFASRFVARLESAA